MNNGNGQSTNTRLVLHVEHRTVYIAAVWVGPIQYHHRGFGFGAGVHQLQHGYIIGVEPQSHVLNVNHQHVCFLQHFNVRRSVFSVIERKNAHARFLVCGVFNMFASIGSTPETMFGGKDAHHIHLIINK